MRNHITRGRVAILGAVTAAFAVILAPAALAVDTAVDTGVNWGDLAGGILTEAKPALIAGVVIMGTILAFSLGKKMFGKVAK